MYCTYLWHPVEQNDCDKVQISESMKLFEEVLREERKPRVLLRLYFITRISPIRVPLEKHLGTGADCIVE